VALRLPGGRSWRAAAWHGAGQPGSQKNAERQPSGPLWLARPGRGGLAPGAGEGSGWRQGLARPGRGGGFGE
jgi:hypothetical protein